LDTFCIRKTGLSASIPHICGANTAGFPLLSLVRLMNNLKIDFHEGAVIEDITKSAELLFFLKNRSLNN
jgi:hypothetical protein